MLVRRYGLDEKDPATLAELGEELSALARADKTASTQGSAHAEEWGVRLCAPRSLQRRDERGLISMETSRRESVFEGPQAEGVGRC